MTKKILIVEARFYNDLSDEMAKGAEEAITKAGYSFEKISVMGALEIPAVINFASQTGKYEGYVALGCVIRGETYHFEIVANESCRGLTNLALKQNLCIGNGILTTEDFDQAWERAKVSEGNKGAFAANACIQLIEIKNSLLKN
jgi:6,7-dimethyl-8-ribityllumazine synthase